VGAVDRQQHDEVARVDRPGTSKVDVFSSKFLCDKIGESTGTAATLRHVAVHVPGKRALPRPVFCLLFLPASHGRIAGNEQNAERALVDILHTHARDQRVIVFAPTKVCAMCAPCDRVQSHARHNDRHRVSAFSTTTCWRSLVRAHCTGAGGVCVTFVRIM
jgi:hypothetical protein